MSAIEQRARELLAAESEGYAKWGILNLPMEQLLPDLRSALRAIIAALTPPQGFALVPVESVRQCECGCHRYSCRSCGTELGGHSYEPTRPEVP